MTISLSGEGAETLRVVRCAQAGNIQTLSVTRWENNALARMCQESLYVGTRRVQQSVGQSYELVSPILPNAYSVADPNSGVNAVMAFGGIPIVGCQGSVLTAILTALIGATLEKKLRKVMPNALDLIMTPFVEFLVTIPFGIGGFIIGATYLLLVITGLHHTYTMMRPRCWRIQDLTRLLPCAPYTVLLTWEPVWLSLSNPKKKASGRQASAQCSPSCSGLVSLCCLVFSCGSICVSCCGTL